MKIDILNKQNSCEPCTNLIKTIQDFIEEYPEINLTYDIYINNTPEGEVKKQEHINRGFPWIGSPTWILYDDDGNYKNTFLGFVIDDANGDKLQKLKNAIDGLEFLHPEQEPIFSGKPKDITGEEYQEME